MYARPRDPGGVSEIKARVAREQAVPAGAAWRVNGG